jgi:arsenate reductase (glutaredoxin)
MSVTIYHNPRCSKSRQALALLHERDIAADVVEYLKTPPDAATLALLLDLLGLAPRELMRTKEAEYEASGADDPALTRDELIALMVRHPKLIERPIVIVDGRAIIGRPPERVLEIL